MPEALARGAVAVVVNQEAPEKLARVWHLLLGPGGAWPRLAMAARNFDQQAGPASQSAGITGTNGDHTCYLADSVLRAAGYTTAMIGTIEYHWPAACV